MQYIFEKNKVLPQTVSMTDLRMIVQVLFTGKGTEKKYC
jgi:hypothetical protein